MPEGRTESLIIRFLRRVGTMTVTLGVLAGAGAAIVFGAQTLADRADAVPSPDAAALTQVAVTPLVIEEGFDVARQFIGQIEAGKTVGMAFELGGRLTALQVEEGEQFAKGDVLMRLDTALLEAERSRLTASRSAIQSQLVFAQSRLKRAEALRQEGFSSQETLDQARATRDELQSRMTETDAALATVAINIEKSALIAPFDGRVGSQFVEQGASLAAGQTVATLIETGQTQVRIGLPLDLPVAALQDSQILVGDAAFPATLTQLRPDIDPVTRTRTALFAIETPADRSVVLGQTARLLVQTSTTIDGTWVALEALKEGAAGTWTMMMVQDGVVRPALVEILHTEPGRAFVRGTFEAGGLVVARGAHRVVAGQAVTTLMAAGG